LSKEAEVFTSTIDSKNPLVNGADLAALMIDHGTGVSTVATHEIKRLVWNTSRASSRT
jgi:restriction system protein